MIRTFCILLLVALFTGDIMADEISKKVERLNDFYEPHDEAYLIELTHGKKSSDISGRDFLLSDIHLEQDEDMTSFNVSIKVGESKILFTLNSKGTGRKVFSDNTVYELVLENPSAWNTNEKIKAWLGAYPFVYLIEAYLFQNKEEILIHKSSTRSIKELIENKDSGNLIDSLEYIVPEVMEKLYEASVKNKSTYFLNALKTSLQSIMKRMERKEPNPKSKKSYVEKYNKYTELLKKVNQQLK